MYHFLKHPNPFHLIKTPEGVAVPEYTLKFWFIARGRIFEAQVAAHTLEGLDKEYERALAEYQD